MTTKIGAFIYIAIVAAVSALLFAYALDAPFFKVYSMIGAIWIAFYFLLPVKYRK
jgi:hypothetical protein